MFHVERIAKNRVVKGITSIFLMCFVFTACFSVKTNPEISDYHILNSIDSKELKKQKPAVFMFENKKSQRSFQGFLSDKLNQKNENRDYPVFIQNEKLIISVLDKVEIEKIFTVEDLVFKKQQPDLIKNGDQKNYVAISVTDKFGNDCLKNSSLYQNLVLSYLKELKIEYSKS